MKRHEIVDNARRQMNLRSFDRPELNDIVELVEMLDKQMASFTTHVAHAKEMMDEYTEFPTMSNHICMELARDNVLNYLKKMADELAEFYAVRLTPVEKRLFPFSAFRMTFEEAIFHKANFGG